MTAEVSRRPGNARPILGRRRGTLRLGFLVRPTDRLDEAVPDLVNRALQAWDNGGHSTAFRLETVGDRLHVVPTACRGLSGGMEPYASPLDTRITLAAEEGNAAGAVERIARAVSVAARRPIELGLHNARGIERLRATTFAAGEPARDVLWRTLDSLGKNLSWHLLCDVGSDTPCAISIYPVRKSDPFAPPRPERR